MGPSVGAHIEIEPVFDSQNGPVPLHGHFQIMPLFPGMVGGLEVLGTIFDPANWLFQMFGDEGYREVLWIKLSPGSESAPDVGLYQVDATFRHIQQL